MSPNVYYYWIKNSKSNTKKIDKQNILNKIEQIYHDNHGVYGYRKIRRYLADEGIYLCPATVHKYLNGELGLKSIQRRKKHDIVNYPQHKVFKNLVKQNFNVAKPNRIWCTDFTYVYLSNGVRRYNCTIIDLYDRSVIASVNSNRINAEVAIKTLKQGLSKNRILKKQLIIHSDQGSQFTSKAFVNYCKINGVTQSMSRKATPTDNSPMERYFNTLKNEYLKIHNFHSESSLYNGINNFAYTTYNHKRKHASLNYLTPFQKRYAR